ncbi:MAG: fimbrillin family protein [Muribaculaceae bacterium]|nr:fimbrillin family protein [Muribaculaceae bacterium]
MNSFSRLLLIIPCAAFLTACSDDSLSESLSSGGKIMFNVDVEADRLSEATPNNPQRPAPHRLSTRRFDSGDLFLVPRQEISSIKRNTRGTALTSETLSDFGVFAKLSPGDDARFYMSNERVTKSSGWSTEEEYLWPGEGALEFIAYSPFCAGDASEGITAIPSPDADGKLSLRYVVPSDVADQQDLLVSRSTTASASPVALNFQHALAGVRFVTGAQMAPCTIKSVTISGVPLRGTLAMENLSWTADSETSSFSINPDLTLEAGADGKYTQAGISIGDSSDLFLLLPGTQPEGAVISIEIETGGKQQQLSASIAGHQWTAGNTTVYNISGSPDSDSLILELTDGDGNKVESIDSPYTGSSFSYSVRSYYSDGSESLSSVKWSATLLDTDGNPLPTNPDWIESFSSSGTDQSPFLMQTQVAAPTFLAMSDQTRRIRSNANINTSSGNTPYNLASSTGASAVETTANSYIINSPGDYSIPLVYGNAIQNGATNSQAYTSTISQTTANKRKALFAFVNHLGNEITSPYIYLNANCTPSGAELVWEDRIGLISDLRLSDDLHNVLFSVREDFIRQGNAVIAVTDAAGNAMWSWHIWITDFTPENNWDNIAGLDDKGNAHTYQLSPINIGRIYGGDNTEFAAKAATLRLTQSEVPDGESPLSIDIPLSQEAKTVYTKTSYLYYQWGRKDPFVSAQNCYYDASHKELDSTSLPTISLGATHLATIEQMIMHPGSFLSAAEADLRKLSTFYCNLWSIDNIATSPSQYQPDNVKTIYDPSPAGMKVPEGNAFIALRGSAVTYDSSTQEITITMSSGATISGAVFGYRNRFGVETPDSQMVQWWTAMSAGAVRSIYLPVQEGTVENLQIFDMNFGFCVRPLRD